MYSVGRIAEIFSQNQIEESHIDYYSGWSDKFTRYWDYILSVIFDG